MRFVKKYNNIKKILVLPSYFVDDKKMKVRIIEIAKGLSSSYRVYLLAWHTTLTGGLMNRLWSCVLDLLQKPRIYKRNSLTMTQFPILHRPLSLALKFNSYFLKKLIGQENIDLVLSGSFHMFDIPESKSFRYIVDLADLPAPGFNSCFDRFVHRQTALEAKKSDAITVVSHGLAQYVSDSYHRRAYVIPNGAYISRLRSVDQAGIDRVRHKYRLTGKWVIGYVGLIGGWVEIDFLVDVFREIKKEITDATLLLVGASPRLRELRMRFSGEDIVLTGVVEEDIRNYFHCLNIAVLPHEKNLYQDLAFHIKLIEYTAARKFVVSTPLEAIKHLNFPNVLTVDLKVSDWVDAIKKAKSMKWSHEWDRLIEPYDWDNIISQLCNIIEGLAKK